MAATESNGKTVLVTGVNGYIASVLADHLLKRGYFLRGTTRRLASTEPLLKGPWASFQDRISIYEVPDITVSGAFDEAVKGVDGIFHTASPIDFSLNHYDQMVLPAVRGTETVLNSALKAGPQLTSVVVTSSLAAIYDPKDDPQYVYTEKDFASAALEIAIKERDEGTTTPVGTLYRASKIAADRAVWKFRDEHKTPFSITTINPCIVIGPPLILPSSPESLNQTLKPIYAIFAGTNKTIGPDFGSGAVVDVRDVALAHVWAYENSSKANGERYLVAQGCGLSQAVADILRDHYKGTEVEKRIPVGEPGKGYVGFDKSTGRVESVDWQEGTVRVSGEKVVRVMGLKYIGLSQSVVDTAKVFEGFA